jgi:hypothetical protein
MLQNLLRKIVINMSVDGFNHAIEIAAAAVDKFIAMVK